MSDEHDYINFRDRVLVSIADEQEPPGLGEIDIFDLVQRHNIPNQETWLHLVSTDLERLGFGKDRSTLSNRRFLINGAGLERATLIRRDAKPKTFVARIQSANWTMWGVILAALVLLAYVVLEGSKS